MTWKKKKVSSERNRKERLDKFEYFIHNSFLSTYTIESMKRKAVDGRYLTYMTEKGFIQYIAVDSEKKIFNVFWNANELVIKWPINV